jgi:hypothetical protein
VNDTGVPRARNKFGPPVLPILGCVLDIAGLHEEEELIVWSQALALNVRFNERPPAPLFKEVN